MAVGTGGLYRCCSVHEEGNFLSFLALPSLFSTLGIPPSSSLHPLLTLVTSPTLPSSLSSLPPWQPPLPWTPSYFRPLLILLTAPSLLCSHAWQPPTFTPNTLPLPPRAVHTHHVPPLFISGSSWHKWNPLAQSTFTCTKERKVMKILHSLVFPFKGRK